MKTARIYREARTDIATEGILEFDGVSLFTIERPWIPTWPGGRRYESCIPAGEYDLVPHTRPNGQRVVALVNPGLAVYHHQDDLPEGVGRFLILLHPANWADELYGCIAPGYGRTTTDRGPMVTRSRDAMRLLMSWEPEKIIIEDPP